MCQKCTGQSSQFIFAAELWASYVLSWQLSYFCCSLPWCQHGNIFGQYYFGKSENQYCLEVVESIRTVFGQNVGHLIVYQIL